MRSFLPLFAILAVAAVPATAQTAAPQPAPEKPKTVTKVVCDRIIPEGETGSRLGTTPKVCRKVEVPVKQEAEKAPGPKGRSGHAI